MNLFKEIWKLNNGHEFFEKSDALTVNEIADIQKKISDLQEKGFPATKIITALQKMNNKLSERWRAERAYWTEVKKDDTQAVGQLADEIGLSKFRVILSPNACHICIDKTNNGRKIFKQQDIEKSGYGHVPPFHPNCYCVIVPVS